MQPYQVFLDHMLSKAKNDKLHTEKIKSALVIRIDDVAEMYAHDKKDEFDIYSDFPNLAPPFESFFLQYLVPPSFLINGEWHDTGGNNCCFVVFVQYVKSKDLWGAALMARLVDVRTKRFLNDTTVTAFISVDGNGRLIKQKEDGSFPVLVHRPSDGLAQAMSKNGAAGWFHIPFLAISLMHCKNVVRVPAPPPPAPVVKQWERRGRPFLKEYTLDIHPMKRVLATEGGMATNGIKKALHICRGHFATYTDDNPLFGKVTGTFWKPMHTRGSSEIGEIKKDYRIKP